MARLLDRNRQIPGGLRFLQPETKWKPVEWSSFSTIVDGLINHRRANPYLAKQHGWKMDRTSVEDEVDEYCAAICKAHGWTGYITEGGPDPKSRSPHGQFAVAAVAGAKIVVDMFGAEGPIQDKSQANQRAETCLVCPKHDQGDWTRFFTQPAQAIIMRTLGAVKDLELKTDHDDQLKICTACYCPMRGKVWARLSHILKHIPAEDKAALDTSCWILKEEHATNPAN